MRLKAAVVSHVGLIRKNNEDNFNLCGAYRENIDETETRMILEKNDRMAVFAVCDGMGGEEAGEIASLIAVKCFHGAIQVDILEEAEKDMNEANLQVAEERKRRGSGRIGCTAAVLYIDDGAAIACNVGDSRVYLFRQGVLRQLTTDHSQTQFLVDAGMMSEDEAEHDRRKHILTQHIGMFPEELSLSPTYSNFFLIKPDDRILICSDGLTDMLSGNEIAGYLSESITPSDTVRDLVGAALRAGGRDNVTVMVVDISKGDE